MHQVSTLRLLGRTELKEKLALEETGTQLGYLALPRFRSFLEYALLVHITGMRSSEQ